MDQLEYGNYHCISWGFMDGRCRHVILALFFVDHVVQPWILSWAVFGHKRSGGMFLFFRFLCFCWQNKNVEQFPLGSARGMIYSAHTHLPLLTKTRLAHTFSFFPLSASHSFCFSSHPITLLLPSAQCKLHSHFFPLLPQLHIYTRTFSSTPPTHSPGCHSNSVGGEHHYCFTPLCNHTPRPLPASPPITSVPPTRPIAAYPTPAGRPQLSANEICCFLRHSRGCKAAQQQWGVKKERS